MAKKTPFRNTDEKGKDGYFKYPLMLSDRTWFYEQRKGITVAHEYRDDKSGILINCNTIDLPWGPLCAAVDNHRRAERRRKAKQR